MRPISWLLLLQLVLLLDLITMATSHPADPVYQRVVVVGDSLSDIGNVDTLTAGAWPLDYYFQGRFSNGLVWAENLAQSLGASLVNLAYGGATSSNEDVQGYTGPDSTIAVPGGTEQLEAYFKQNPNVEGTLFVVFIGLNDYYFEPTVKPRVVVSNAITIMNTIFVNGGKDFLIPRLPHLGDVPHYRGNPLKEDLNEACAQHNELLTEEALLFMKTRDKTRVFLWYADYLFEAAQRKPSMFDLRDATTACVKYINDTATFCTHPDQYLFWDTFHPTTKFHSVMAKYAADLIDSALSVADTQPDGFAYDSASHATQSLSTLLLSVFLLSIFRDYAL